MTPALKAALSSDGSSGSHGVDALLKIAQEKTSEGRASLYGAISDLFEEQADTLSDGERQIMVDILRRLSTEVEMSVRKRLAERLADNQSAPPDLIQMLADDQLEVSYSILSRSRVLHDTDLIEIIRHRTMQHQLAIAIRDNLSEDVSRTLVESGEEDVIVALLNNEKAQISNDVMAYLVEESRRVDRFQQPLVRRPDLPGALAQKMFAWVSAALRNYIIENYEIDPHALDDQIAETVEEELSGESAEANSPAAKLVKKLHDAKQLTPEFAIKALTQGQVTLFELAFARLVGIRSSLARRIIYEPGGEAMAIACVAIGAGPETFHSLFVLTRRARIGDGRVKPKDRVRLNDLMEKTSREDAQVVVRKWRRNPDYLAAIRELGQAA